MVASSKRLFRTRLFGARLFATANFRGVTEAPAPVESSKRLFRTRLFNTRLFAPANFRGKTGPVEPGVGIVASQIHYDLLDNRLRFDLNGVPVRFDLRDNLAYYRLNPPGGQP